MLMRKQAINKSIARMSPRTLIEKNEAEAAVRERQWNDLVFRRASPRRYPRIRALKEVTEEYGAEMLTYEACCETRKVWWLD